MASKSIRKLRLFSVHGFINPSEDEQELLEYERFFSNLRTGGYKEFRQKRGDETVAIAQVRELEGHTAYLFVRGSESSVTIFNERTGVAEEADLPADSIAVSATWLIWKKRSRYVFVESNRPGVGTAVIERFFTSYGREVLGYKEFTFGLNAIPGPAFEDQIHRLTRIREVSVVLTRPNHVWSVAEDLIGDAADSNAGTVEVSARAERKQSLAKDRGIVQGLLQYARSKITGLKNARVSGKMPGTEGEYVVSLENSQMTASAKIVSGADPEENLQALAEAVEGFEEENLRELE
ncbi:hypothetical protein AALI21_13045 [Corynebacteriaceae bacterium 6-324]